MRGYFTVMVKVDILKWCGAVPCGVVLKLQLKRVSIDVSKDQWGKAIPLGLPPLKACVVLYKMSPHTDMKLVYWLS